MNQWMGYPWENDECPDCGKSAADCECTEQMEAEEEAA